MNKKLINRKLILFGLSILVFIFLTGQACQFGAISTGLAADCAGEGDIVCDDTEAYQCQLATYGTGYYVSRAPTYDVDICGAEEDVGKEGVEGGKLLCGDGVCDEYEEAHDACLLDCAVVDDATISITDVIVETGDVCVDEDGQDYYTLGTTSGTYEDVTSDYDDSCIDVTTLSEYYCDDSDVALELFSCGTGYSCLDGACEGYVLRIDEITDEGFSSDGNEFSYLIDVDNEGLVDAYNVFVGCALDVQTQGEISVYSYTINDEVIDTITADGDASAGCIFDITLLRDYLSTSDLQEGEELLATVTVVVTDSEGAKDGSLESKWVYGTDITAQETTTTVECTEKTEADDCSGYACKSDGTCYETCTYINSLTGSQIGCADGYVCTFGGTCVPEAGCTTDEDCDNGYACKSDGTCYETCGTLTVKKLGEIEYGCAEDYYECTDGECVEVCSDSDGGDKPAIEGTVTGPLTEGETATTKTDFCESIKILAEYVCTDGVIGAIYYTCSPSCIDAVCEDAKVTMATSDDDDGISTITTGPSYIIDTISDDDDSSELSFVDSYAIDDYLLFQLEDFTDHAIDSQGYFSNLIEESKNQLGIARLKDVYAQEASESETYYFYFPSSSSDSYVEFADAPNLNPKEWIIVQADVFVFAEYLDTHQVILAKLTSKCGYPKYSLTTKGGKYHFIVSIDSEKYVLDSTTPVDSKWRQIRGVYTGEKIELYVSGELEDSEIVSGLIKPKYGTAADSLVFGYSTVCDDFDFNGYIDDIYIWGELGKLSD